MYTKVVLLACIALSLSCYQNAAAQTMKEHEERRIADDAKCAERQKGYEQHCREKLIEQRNSVRYKVGEGFSVVTKGPKGSTLVLRCTGAGTLAYSDRQIPTNRLNAGKDGRILQSSACLTNEDIKKEFGAECMTPKAGSLKGCKSGITTLPVAKKIDLKILKEKAGIRCAHQEQQTNELPQLTICRDDQKKVADILKDAPEMQLSPVEKARERIESLMDDLRKSREFVTKEKLLEMEAKLLGSEYRMYRREKSGATNFTEDEAQTAAEYFFSSTVEGSVDRGIFINSFLCGLTNNKRNCSAIGSI